MQILKNSWLWSAAFTVLLLGASNLLSAENSGLPQTWDLIGPGDADQTTSAVVFPSGEVLIGTDIGGIYSSNNQGVEWHALNQGLKNYDITTPVYHDSDRRFYVGTRGGYYKSDDGGQHWRNIREGLPPVKVSGLRGSIGAIAIDPFDNKNLVLGMGYRPSSDGTTTVKKLGWVPSLYFSNDYGESWEAREILPLASKVNDIKFSLNTSGRIFIATDNGLVLKEGERIEIIYPQRSLNVMVFKNQPKRLLVAAANKGVFETRDLGKTWLARNAGLTFYPHRSGPNRYSVLAASPDEKTLYVANSTWGKSGGAYKSIDGGAWVKLTAALPESWLKTSSRINTIAVNANSPEQLYLGSSRYVYRSDNGGESWQQLISKPVSDSTEKPGWTHRGINVFGHTRDIEIDPVNKQRLYMATADHGAVYSNDVGQSWHKLESNLIYENNVLDLATCGSNLYASTISRLGSGNSCFSVSKDGGNNWGAMCRGLKKGNEIRQLLVTGKNCENAILATREGLMVRADGAGIWHKASSISNKAAYALAVSPKDTKLIYAGGKDGLLKSADGGENWRKIDIGRKVIVTSILLSSANPNLILVGGELGKYTEAAIYRSNDGGKNWQKVVTGLGKYVSGIVELPEKTNVIYAATNDHNYHDDSNGAGVLRSEDDGLTWQNVTDNLPVSRAWNITVNAAYPDQVFLSANGSGGYVRHDSQAEKNMSAQ
ncbi:MAG: hypothetical protein GY814_17730 [Gammaproteobacteria bacterium]|nr:hypothetical protein [Gammaproteobacteria bacterium]